MPNPFAHVGYFVPTDEELELLESVGISPVEYWDKDTGETEYLYHSDDLYAYKQLVSQGDAMSQSMHHGFCDDVYVA